MEFMNVHADVQTVVEYGYSYMSPISGKREYRSTYSPSELQANVLTMIANRPDIDPASVDYFIRRHSVSRWELVGVDKIKDLG